MKPKLISLSLLLLISDLLISPKEPDSRKARISALCPVTLNHMLTNNNQPENPQGGISGNPENTKKKIIELPENSWLNQKIIEELNSLLEFSSPKEINRHLRDVFILSLTDEDHIMLHDVQLKIENFYFLFKFFDLAEDEIKKSRGE